RFSRFALGGGRRGGEARRNAVGDHEFIREVHALQAGAHLLARGEAPKEGTQDPARHTVEPVGALSSLHLMVGENHDYRSEW
ncbi:MAG: hypothetical protein ACEQR8_09635, partial [Cypionkella sp.]